MKTSQFGPGFLNWNEISDTKKRSLFNFTGSLKQFNSLYLSLGAISSHSWPSVPRGWKWNLVWGKVHFIFPASLNKYSIFSPIWPFMRQINKWNKWWLMNCITKKLPWWKLRHLKTELGNWPYQILTAEFWRKAVKKCWLVFILISSSILLFLVGTKIFLADTIRTCFWLWSSLGWSDISGRWQK